MSSSREYAGYLYVHFKRESANGEQIHFALSDGNDPLHFDDLNGGKPVFYSTLGEHGVRDPHVVRSPEGDRFYLVATDLRVHDSLDWDRHVRRGSRSIMVWESTDLVDWGEGRLVEIAPPAAGNTWAPESIWDPEQAAYLVHWSSTLYADEAHEGESHQRIMYATTRDFREFSEPRVWIDRGWHTIDTTLIEHRGVYYRFLKDERARGGAAPNGKSIFSETADSLTKIDWKPLAEGIGLDAISRGEGPLVYKSNTEDKVVPLDRRVHSGTSLRPLRDDRPCRRPMDYRHGLPSAEGPLPWCRAAGDRRGVRPPQHCLANCAPITADPSYPPRFLRRVAADVTCRRILGPSGRGQLVRNVGSSGRVRSVMLGRSDANVARCGGLTVWSASDRSQPLKLCRPRSCLNCTTPAGVSAREVVAGLVEDGAVVSIGVRLELVRRVARALLGSRGQSDRVVRLN